MTMILATIGALTVLWGVLLIGLLCLYVRAERRRQDRQLSFMIALAEWDGREALERDANCGKRYLLPKERAR